MITAWSASRYGTYCECPAKAKYKFVDKIPEPGSTAMDRGSAIHKGIELYLRDEAPLPDTVTTLREEYAAMALLEPMVELELAFDDKWNRVDWFSKKCWVRVKIDALVPPVIDTPDSVVRVIDHKTGKVKEYGEYDEQLELYGLVGLLMYPYAEKATGELWFVDHGQIIKAKEDYQQKDLADLKKRWEIRVKKMMSDTTFRPKPGSACRWCHFRKTNAENGGGQCVF